MTKQSDVHLAIMQGIMERLRRRPKRHGGSRIKSIMLVKKLRLGLTKFKHAKSAISLKFGPEGSFEEWGRDDQQLRVLLTIKDGDILTVYLTLLVGGAYHIARSPLCSVELADPRMFEKVASNLAWLGIELDD
jgi:hypothetical protein